MPRETPSHKRYMEGYNRKRHREELEAGGTLADPAGAATFDWPAFYTKLYQRLGLNEYLPKVLSEMSDRASKVRLLSSSAV